MATYYVRTDGNDGNSGTENNAANAWLTVHKAITTVSAGDTVKIGAGTYAENSGSNYLSIQNSFASTTTFESTSGLNDVIITPSNAAATYVLYVGSGVTEINNITFNNITFSALNSTQVYVARLIFANNLNFNGCKFIGYSGAGTVYCFGMIISGASTVRNVNLTNVTVRGVSGGTAKIIGIGQPATTAVSNITVTNPNIYIDGPSGTASYGIVFSRSETGISISGGTVVSTNSVAVVIGGDTAPGSNSIATISGVTAISYNSHAVLLGWAEGSSITGSTIYGGDHGLVLKNIVTTGVTATTNRIYGGKYSAVLFKGANNSSVTNNVLINQNSGAVSDVVTVEVNAAQKSGNNTLTYNTMYAGGASNIFIWGDSSADSGGSVCDYNAYILGGSGNFGSVYGTASVADLAALKTAWSSYDVTTNDRNSTMGTSVGRLPSDSRTAATTRTGV